MARRANAEQKAKDRAEKERKAREEKEAREKAKEPVKDPLSDLLWTTMMELWMRKNVPEPQVNHGSK